MAFAKLSILECQYTKTGKGNSKGPEFILPSRLISHNFTLTNLLLSIKKFSDFLPFYFSEKNIIEKSLNEYLTMFLKWTDFKFSCYNSYRKLSPAH